MWKIVALSALALLAVLGSTVDVATAQTPPPSAPAATQPAPVASPGKRTLRHASRHHRRRHAASLKCFGQEWRAFPTRDPKGYFYTPPGGGIC